MMNAEPLNDDNVNVSRQPVTKLVSDSVNVIPDKAC